MNSPIRTWTSVFWAVCLAAAVIDSRQALGEEPEGAGVRPAAHAPATDDRAGSFGKATLVRELMRRRGGDAAAAAQLIQLCRDMSPKVASELYDELARAHLAANSLDLAAETRRLLVGQFPDEPLAAEAQLWLTRVYASSEVALAHRQPGEEAADDATHRGMALYAFQIAGGDGAPAGGRKGDPALVFQRAVAARRAGMQKAADGLLVPLKHARAGDAWGDCARAEAWIKDGGTDAPPKSVVRCAPAPWSPRLDAVLDEPWWTDAPATEVALVGNPVDVSSGEPPPRAGRVRLAYDADYLYIAVECPRLPGVAYPRDERPRPHDGDLSHYDRVRLVIDVDRDYATGFDLTVDSRGWTTDRCWDDPAWNPQWFVAAKCAPALQHAPTPWIVEAAIPWSALADRPPLRRDAWACVLERYAPSKTADASGNQPGPERFGVLLFD